MKERKITFEYCALQYLNIYFDNDRECHEALLNGNTNDKLKALKKAGNFYSVARNLPRKYDIDEGKKRYEPVLEVLDSIKKEQIGEPVDFVEKIQDKISDKYGGRGVLSLTTKFLWLKIKQPSILIYDSQVRKVLDTENGDYGDYYNRWKGRYKEHEDDIRKACLKLNKQYLYLKNQYNGLQEEIEEISSKPWFHERVFDTYLWHQYSNDKS